MLVRRGPPITSGFNLRLDTVFETIIRLLHLALGLADGAARTRERLLRCYLRIWFELRKHVLIASTHWVFLGYGATFEFNWRRWAANCVLRLEVILIGTFTFLRWKVSCICRAKSLLLNSAHPGQGIHTNALLIQSCILVRGRPNSHQTLLLD